MEYVPATSFFMSIRVYTAGWPELKMYKIALARSKARRNVSENGNMDE